MRDYAWLVLAGAVAVGCSDSAGDADNGADGSQQESRSYDELAEELPPEERRYWDAGRPFIEALAGQRYSEAYQLLSAHARARMSLNQFVAPENQPQAAANEREPLVDVAPETFAELVQKVADAYGEPIAVSDLYVQSIDPEVLAGHGDRLDVLFSIGSMPETIPAEIRKASLRGQIATKFKPEDLKRIADEYNVSPEAVERDDELAPYFTIKYVLVEEEGSLKVGYFEFLPPSIWD